MIKVVMNSDLAYDQWALLPSVRFVTAIRWRKTLYRVLGCVATGKFRELVQRPTCL